MRGQPADVPSISPRLPVRAILDRHPIARGVLQQFGIDACCGGALTLEEVCHRHGLRLSEILAALDRACPPHSARSGQFRRPSAEPRAPFAPTTSIRDILSRFPQTAPIFEKHGLMGCGGPGGPDEPLEFFARVHHVPFDTLVEELHAAVAQPPAQPPAPQAAPPTGIARSEKAALGYVPFLIASLVLTLTFGATLGMINLIRLTTALLGPLPRPSVWAHAYVQVFGFVGLFVMGMAYHVIPRFAGCALQSPRHVRWSFWLQLGGVAAIASAFIGAEALALPLRIGGSLALIGASLLFTATIARTLAAGARAPERFEPWVIAGAGWMVAASAVTAAAAIVDDTTWHHVIWPMALYGFAGSWIFGVGRRIFPVFIGWTPKAAGWDIPLFITYQLGVLAWSAGAWPVQNGTLVTLRGLGAMALLMSVPAFAYQLGMFGRREPPGRDLDRGYELYIFAAWGWLFVALATGPLWTIAALAQGRYGSVTMLDFSRHALALGFVTQMIMGVASRVLPVFTGHALWSPRARSVAFWLLNGSLGIRGLEALVAAGYWSTAWSLIALSGPPAVAAVFLFAVNIAMTMAVGGVAQRDRAKASSSADWIVADLLELPGALEVLVEAGFEPLRNPVMRASFAKAVTLGQACRLKGVALAPLAARLDRLRSRTAGLPRPDPADRTVIPLKAI